MDVPEALEYTKEHEWLAIAGATARIGITRNAADALGDIVYVSLPHVGDEVSAGAACGEIESTKSVSDLYSPATGRVVTTNDFVLEQPGTINSDPYGSGWLFEVQVESLGELLDAAQYRTLIQE